MENNHLERSNCFEDRLSTLPEELLLKILPKTLSYKEVVKCSVLSKRWTDLYTGLSTVCFDEREMIKGFRYDLDEEQKKNLISKFVFRALCKHKGVVDTFSWTVTDNMQWWHCCLDYVAKHPIKELTLRSIEYSILEEFPFSCENLLTLDLCNVQCDSMANKEFPNLKTCILWFQSYDGLWLKRFLSKCPALYHLEFIAEFPSQLSPFTFQAGSLQSLNLCLSEFQREGAVEIRIEAPRLLKLVVDCVGSDSKLTLKVEAPALIESLEIAGELDLEDLEDIRKYVALKVLKLEFFKIYPVATLWEMLCHLPLLESLTLSCCTFEDHDEFSIQEEEDLDLEVSNATETGDLIYTKKYCRESGLTEIRIQLTTNRWEELEREEREMIQLFWVKATNLKKLVVNVDMDRHLNKTKYLKFFQFLMSTGDKVHMTENDGDTTFHLIKKSRDGLLSNS